MKLIIGLGNPGQSYAHNRHNIGFMCLRHFARTHGIRFDKKQCQARTGAGEVAGNKLILARPQTYMNLSGESASRLVKKFKVSLNDLIIIHDDLDLPLGKIRIRQGGSSGGHNGIESTIAHLGSQDFTRIKVGIGRPPMTESSAEDKEAEVVAHVLNDFTPEEKEISTQVITKVNEAILHLLTKGLTSAMNRYN